MKLAFTLIILYISLLVSAATTDTVKADNNLIEYTGRIDFSSPQAPTFSYSGVSIRACFKGTAISAILQDDSGQNYYNVILDGEPVKVLAIEKGKQTYLLAENLSKGVHEIELFKRTELTFGKTTFHGFLLEKGKTLTQIKNDRKMFFEFIGNSITCGYGNEGVNGDKFVPETENHYMTYAAITSRNFNARHMAVSRSGIGIYRNYDGPDTGNYNCMTNLYSRIFLYDSLPLYSFKKQPDFVFINLGTNDFSTTGGDSVLYVSNYLRLIDSIQSKYTKSNIVCLLGPMLSGSTLDEVRNYIQHIAITADKKGKGKVWFFEMSAQTGDLGIGADYHPTVEQNKKNAEELTEFIKQILKTELN